MSEEFVVFVILTEWMVQTVIWEKLKTNRLTGPNFEV